LREHLEGAGHHLGGDRGDGEVAAGLGDFVAVLLADLFERGDVGLVELRDVRDRIPRVAEMLGGLAADAGHRLALDLAPLREVRHRRSDADGAAARGCRRGLAVAAQAVHHALGEFLDVILRNASAGPGAGHLRNIDANLAGQPAHRWRGGSGGDL
jgi:hypothetical protein